MSTNKLKTKVTIIDPFDEKTGVTHYHGELEETVEKIIQKHELPFKKIKGPL